MLKNLTLFRAIPALLFLLHAGFVSKCSAAYNDTIRILFVGNSLTYTNDLPAMVRELGEQDGKPITCHSFLFPNYALEDHWNEGKVQAALEKEAYDFVIMQQGPSAAPESQALLLEYVQKFAGVCNRKGAKPVVYMVWPSKTRSSDHDNVIHSYTKAAEKTSSLLCAAGLAWKYAWQADAGLSLYSADNFHPSVTGSVLAALVIYGTLTGKKDFYFINFDSCSWKSNMTEERLDLLKQAALKAMANK